MVARDRERGVDEMGKGGQSYEFPVIQKKKKKKVVQQKRVWLVSMRM